LVGNDWLPLNLVWLMLAIKLGIIPFHLWLITMYRSLHLGVLFIYLLAYVCFAIIVFFHFLLVWGGGGGVYLSGSLLPILTCLISLRLGTACTLRGVILMSSVLNFSLLWLNLSLVGGL
jgi:uncharacterized membrane protein (DUF106 family)